MKIKFTKCILLFAILLVLQACCSKEDLVGDDTGKFIFLNKITDDNLFFGSNKTLNKDSIFISYNSNNNYQKLNISANDQDSVIIIDFNSEDTCFIKFSDNDIDTFNVKYQIITGKSSVGRCKLSAVVIIGITYNGVSLNTSDIQNTIKIYK